MNIGAIAVQPYIFNANSISGSSMNKISGITDDVLNKKIDYSGLTSLGENENPLKKGTSSNFMDILSSQMEMGKSNAAKIMKPMEEVNELVVDELSPEGIDPIENQSNNVIQDTESNNFDLNNIIEAISSNDSKSIGAMYENNSQNSGVSLYQMAHASQAYEMSMNM